ncbi:hypothetical protein PR202_gb14320 [Eleusine coracana subsp. coracana]|uniref:Speckle-type POZ protein-like protein n=1 Tax=Eleusine coracana subsp. coracana TaxID=191504 RepID=A0AAV5EVB7_ELECO|nr:hypothetical protein PR202_gb14320 [Eleusine coracana subsp. coracana]
MARNSIPVVNQSQCLSKTSSRCVTRSVTASHDFVVTDFSLLDGMGSGKFIISSTFRVSDHDWSIKLYPDGDRTVDKAAYLSVFLYCRGTTPVRAKFSLNVLVGKDDQVSKLLGFTHTFKPTVDNQGWSRFIEKSKLQELLHLNNDCFTIRCVVTVIKDHRIEDTCTILVPESNLPQNFERMLKDRKDTNVTFSVDGQIFHAHKCVLAARSSVFEAELLGPLKKKISRHVKVIHDMEPSIFKAILHFIYTDSLPVNCEASETATMQKLLVAADRYGLQRLRLMCEAKLSHGIDVRTVATTLTLAEQHHCVQLKNACLRFIASPEVQCFLPS